MAIKIDDVTFQMSMNITKSAFDSARLSVRWGLKRPVSSRVWNDVRESIWWEVNSLAAMF